jgi:hypothetical protein
MLNLDDVRNHSEVGTGYTKDAMLNLAANEIESLRSQLTTLEAALLDYECLQAKLEAAEKGAARYRALRRNIYESVLPIGEAYLSLRVVGVCPSSDEFDAAIDAAIEASKQND